MSVRLFRSLMLILSAVTIVLSGQVFGQEVGNGSYADEPDSVKSNYGPWNKLSIVFGGFFAGYNSGITLGADDVGLGLVVDVEDVLGLTTSSLAFRGHIDYRFGRRQRSEIYTGFFSINRNTTKVLDKELQLGEQVYPIGTEIKSRYNFSIVRLKYSYYFLQDERVSMGASFGFFIMPLSFRVEAPGLVAQGADFVAPLPMVGLNTAIRLTPKFQLNQNSELLYLAIAGIQGSLLDLSLTLDYALTRRFGLGIGVNSNKIDVRVVKDAPVIDFFGNVQMSYTGAILYAKYRLY